MIKVYFLAALVAIIAYLATARFGPGTRTVITLLVFLIPSVAMTAWVLIVGDPAPSGSVDLAPDDIYPGRSADAERPENDRSD